eukprot:TRINITY_DN8685_c0_g1_i1.p1 TRINITY_DN8685_c0_g1~~TRINITY_DN8685_c0_g1_i1.p1  ORF type:complete len:334 (-),score=26.48 TRINITY_DN8685_c0_g1_i1:274-1275(-)
MHSRYVCIGSRSYEHASEELAEPWARVTGAPASERSDGGLARTAREREDSRRARSSHGWDQEEPILGDHHSPASSSRARPSCALGSSDSSRRIAPALQHDRSVDNRRRSPGSRDRSGEDRSRNRHSRSRSRSKLRSRRGGRRRSHASSPARGWSSSMHSRDRSRQHRHRGNRRRARARRRSNRRHRDRDRDCRRRRRSGRRRRSDSRRHRYSSSFAQAAAVDPSQRLPCGLTSIEVLDLLSREITPDDYELLLRLDKAVAKPVASNESIEALPDISPKDFEGGDCAICLTPFKADSKVTAMLCKHHFHRECLVKWLSECRKTCPLCGKEALPS